MSPKVVCLDLSQQLAAIPATVIIVTFVVTSRFHTPSVWPSPCPSTWTYGTAKEGTNDKAISNPSMS
jgi:hypothetical protein